MSLYSGAFATAIIAAGFVQANWIEVVLPGPVNIRLQDGSAADITFSGKTFTSRDATYGVLAAPPQAFEDGEGDTAPSLDFAILPPNASAASTLLQAANQGSAVTLWWGIVDPATGLVIGTPDQQFIGEFDVSSLIAGRNSYRVNIQATGVMDRLMDPDPGVGMNHATQNSIWSEDGFGFVTDVNVSLPWGQDAQRASLITDGGVNAGTYWGGGPGSIFGLMKF